MSVQQARTAAAPSRLTLEPDTIPSSFVRVTETNIPNKLEALTAGVAVSINVNDGSYRSTKEPGSSEACFENRLCGPGHICCEAVCTVCHFARIDVVFFG